jgi:hypothetical protein
MNALPSHLCLQQEHGEAGVSTKPKFAVVIIPVITHLPFSDVNSHFTCAQDMNLRPLRSGTTPKRRDGIEVRMRLGRLVCVRSDTARAGVLSVWTDLDGWSVVMR